MNIVYNCDCLDFLRSEVFKSLDKSRLIVVTDPPFNIGYHYGFYKDRMSDDSYFSMLGQVISSAHSSVIIHYPEALHRLSIELGRVPEKVVSWVYNSNTAKQHRDIAFYGIKPDMGKVRQPYKNPNDKRIKERIAKGIGGGRLYDWWNINQVKNVSKKGFKHPCIMPLEVMERIVGILPDDAIIFDPFCGSGTTRLACLGKGREFVGCEIDHDYWEEQERRYQSYCNTAMDLFSFSETERKKVVDL